MGVVWKKHASSDQDGEEDMDDEDVYKNKNVID